MGAIYKLFMLSDGKCFEYQNNIYQLVRLSPGGPALVFNPTAGKEEKMSDDILVRPIIGYKMVAVELKEVK